MREEYLPAPDDLIGHSVKQTMDKERAVQEVQVAKELARRAIQTSEQRRQEQHDNAVSYFKNKGE